MKVKIRELGYLLLFAPLASLGADTNDIKFTLSADSAHSDNATKKQLDEDKIAERQESYIAGIDGKYENKWSQLKTDYVARKEVYGAQSQPDYSMLEGKTAAKFGNQYQPVSILLTHSRVSLLSSPDQPDSTYNRDQRNMIGAEPALRFHITHADLLAIKANYEEVTYRIDESKKSKRVGGELDWQRGFTKVDQLQVSAQQLKTTFEGFPSLNYTYQNIAALYSVKLSHFDYAIGVGQNHAEMERDNSGYTKPAYNLSSSYTSGNHSFKLEAKQVITDASRGDGNSEHLSNTSQALKGVGVELINLRTTQFTWTIRNLCDRCDFNINAQKEARDYKTVLEDGTQTGVGSSFRYKFTRASSASIRLYRTEVSFDSGSQFSGYKSNRVNISYEYSFANQLKINVYGEQEKRTSEKAIQNYDENKTGVRLTYSF